MIKSKITRFSQINLEPLYGGGRTAGAAPLSYWSTELSTLGFLRQGNSVCDLRQESPFYKLASHQTEWVTTCDPTHQGCLTV